MNPQESGSVSYNSGSSGRKNLLTTAVLTILLVISLVFGGWAFSKMQSYKNDSDKKSAAAVAAAEKTQAAALQAKFDETNKSPYKTFSGSPTYGTITFNYPKSWSAYADTTGQTEPINAYFQPDVIPGLQSKTAFALRLELLSTDYAQVVQQLTSSLQGGKATARAYVPPKLNGIANVQPGTLFSGQLSGQDSTQNITMLAIKVRDKTLEIYTESNDYLSDFNNIVLGNLSFAP